MKNNGESSKQILVMLITYLVMFIIGIISMVFPSLGFNNPVLYASVLFYILAFFGIVGYFWAHEEKKDYELLFFSLINIITASYLFISEFTKIPFTLGTGFLIFVVLESFNKIYHTNKMKKLENQFWILRSISIILLLFLSILTIQNFYRSLSEVQTSMMGYYFLTFGLISSIELIICTQVKEKTFERVLNGNFDEIKKDRKPKMKKLKSINENVDELDEIVKNIEQTKRKKRTNKKK